MSLVCSLCRLGSENILIKMYIYWKCLRIQKKKSTRVNSTAMPGSHTEIIEYNLYKVHSIRVPQSMLFECVARSNMRISRPGYR